jgi:hypothetical protein
VLSVNFLLLPAVFLYDSFHIGMSYAFRQSGYLAGILLLGLVAILTGKER